ncbi:MAG: hypothetical protein GTO62_08560, partial [Planctomycetales bacterium]|nr:hypothetical protein [Planctomycetales bacterium]NIP69307.1 hypothetical protein [Planctomycetales bacterium]
HELYNLREDPSEQVNRIEQQPERAEKMRSQLAALLEECKAGASTP